MPPWKNFEWIKRPCLLKNLARALSHGYASLSHSLNASREICSWPQSFFLALAALCQAANCFSVYFPDLIQAKRRLYSRRYSWNTRSLRRLSAHFRTGAVLRQSFPDGPGRLQYSAVIRPVMGKYLPQFLQYRTGMSRLTHSRREKSIKSRIVLGYRISPQPPFLIAPKLMGIGAQSERVRYHEAGQRTMFSTVFQTITVDNGSEFADNEGLERSCLRRGKKRTTLCYCHPYSSSERGSNEKQNGMTRRHPKGTDFKRVSQKKLRETTDWINNYPRKIFGFIPRRSFSPPLSLAAPPCTKKFIKIFAFLLTNYV